ncbi:MAG: HAD family hydrolase [Ignavibacteria bacterium]|nr:HAD family hydrolase [Ignavibacteria bacterium]
MKAIFLDRDGTINEEVDYLLRKEDIKLIDGTIDALDIFKKLGFLNIIITNQSAVARGFLTIHKLDSIHKEMVHLLQKDGINLIDDIFYSPYHIDGIIPEFKKNSGDRKPGTGLIEKAQKKYNIDLKNSFLIGDSLSDMKCALNAGLKSVLVLTGYGQKTLKECEKENLELYHAAVNLLDAANFIENKLRKR